MNKQNLNPIFTNFEDCSSVEYKSETKKQEESNKNNSSIKGFLSAINNGLNGVKTNIINLIQVNINNEANNNNDIVITEIKKKSSKKIKRANFINSRIKFSFDCINFYSVSKILKYLIYLRYLNHPRNKFMYIKNKEIIVKYSTNESNFTICDLLYYYCLYDFSSIKEDQNNVCISFLNNNLLVFFRGKGGTMVLISYPYGYLLANILHLMNLNSFII